MHSNTITHALWHLQVIWLRIFHFRFLWQICGKTLKYALNPSQDAQTPERTVCLSHFASSCWNVSHLHPPLKCGSDNLKWKQTIIKKYTQQITFKCYNCGILIFSFTPSKNKGNHWEEPDGNRELWNMDFCMFFCEPNNDMYIRFTNWNKTAITWQFFLQINNSIKKLYKLNKILRLKFRKQSPSIIQFVHTCLS